MNKLVLQGTTNGGHNMTMRMRIDAHHVGECWTRKARPKPAHVLLNRGAGSVARDRTIAGKVEDALRKVGLEAEIELIDRSECGARCGALSRRGVPLLIVGGGDGTVSAAAAALAGTDTLLGILPLGTLNHFARDLGLPLDLDGAAAVIARGKARRVDVGEMNGRTFVNNSAIGLYPLMVIDRDLQRMQLGRSKPLAMAVASLRTLARFGHQRLTLTVNDRKAEVDTPLLFVGNNGYRIDLGAPGRRARLGEGELSLIVMRKKTRLGFLAAAIRALLRKSREDDMVAIRGVDRLRVASRREQLAVSLDGQVVRLAPPLDYSIHKRALRVAAP